MHRRGCLTADSVKIPASTFASVRITRKSDRLRVSGRMIDSWHRRPRVMKPKQKCKAKKRAAKSVLQLPDLEVAKSAVLSSLSCPDAQRGDRHAIDEFVDWYCSEPRLSFSKAVVIRYTSAARNELLRP